MSATLRLVAIRMKLVVFREIYFWSLEDGAFRRYCVPDTSSSIAGHLDPLRQTSRLSLRNQLIESYWSWTCDMGCMTFRNQWTFWDMLILRCSSRFSKVSYVHYILAPFVTPSVSPKTLNLPLCAMQYTA
jgi:hypothetical protein